jgi:hypothetical protein
MTALLVACLLLTTMVLDSCVMNFPNKPPIEICAPANSWTCHPGIHISET